MKIQEAIWRKRTTRVDRELML